MSLKLMRRRVTMKWLSNISLVWVVFLAGCFKTQTEGNDTTNNFITVVSVEAIQGQGTTTTGDDLFSDICDNSSETVCVAFNDSALITLRGAPKDQGSPLSTVNSVVFERYRVSYIRSDGRNVPGVDVPYSFDGATNFSVLADGTTSGRTLMVVRQQAKLETPLRNLRSDAGAPGNLILSVIAQIELFGRDGAGRAIKVTAFLNITFADFS